MLVATFVCTVAFAPPAAAQFEAGAFVAVANPGQFNDIDLGLGGRASWRPDTLPLVTIEAELAHYPSEYPADEAGSAFSSARWDAFFGGTVGPQLGPLRPFAKLRPGFVSYQKSPEPLACIAIFPPPLVCSLAEGATLAALDVGGGLEVVLTDRSRVRLDLGDRMVRYEGPVRDLDGELHDEAFWGHDLRVTLGVGYRF